MPKVSEFHGIEICIYFADHAPPHVHVAHAGCKARIEIATCRMTDGFLPPREYRHVRKWVRMHQRELVEDWDLARRCLPLKPIIPLK